MIREWAREQGMTVGDRGLLPHAVIEAYKVAHHIGQRSAAPRLTVVKCPDGCGRWAVYRHGRPAVDDHDKPTDPGIYRDTWREAMDAAFLWLALYRAAATKA